MTDKPEIAEDVVWEGGPSQVLNLGTYILCTLLSVLIVPIFMGIWAYVVTRTTRYTLTTQRLSFRRGVFSKETDVIELYRIKDMKVAEPFFLRLFGKGDIVLDTSDRSHPEFTLRAVPAPEKLRDTIRGLVEKRRDEKRVQEVDFE